MRLLKSPETQIELWLIFILTPIATAIGTYVTRSLFWGILIGIGWEILQLSIQKMIIRIYNLLKDEKILSPVREFLKNPADTQGIIVSPSQYRKVLESLAKPAKRKFNAICTISPADFMADDKSMYRKIHEEKSNIST